MPSCSNNILAQIHYAERLGVVDDQLRRLYDLKEDSDPHFFENLYTRFLNDTASRLARIEHLLNHNAVDFYNLAKETILIIGSSSNIGAFRLAMACRNLQLAADNCSKDGCFEALNVVKIELTAVKPHLDAILQIERGTIF